MIPWIKTGNPILLAGVVLFIGGTIALLMATTGHPATPTGNPEVDKSGFIKAPELSGISGYLNTVPGLTLGSLKGKVVLVDFWTYSCINCIRTVPHLNEWNQKYAGQGLVILGVHSPEFEFEKDYANVKVAVEKLEILFPVVQDNAFTTWRAYRNQFWPHKYLIDADGFIRYDHIGEGSYAETEEKIVQLLNERNPGVKMTSSSNAPESTPDFPEIGTPEIYFGYDFFRPNSPRLGNPEGFRTETDTHYTFPDSFQLNRPYLEGTWKTTADYTTLNSENGRIALRFRAKNANIVAGAPPGTRISVWVDGIPATPENAGADVRFENGNPVSMIKTRTLYHLVSGTDYSEKTLILDVNGNGFEIYSFTFG
ncbi:MAG: thioredoxin family protein [Candidatus Diapherotrites archaeon]|nr:thioredoxin family protein [Candidatus Diapherotrites archaeon]